MSFLLCTLFLACQNAQAGPTVRVLTSEGELTAPFLGWSEGGPWLGVDFPSQDWWVVEFPHPVVLAEDWNLELSDGAWLPGHPVEGATSPQWQLAGLPQTSPLELDTLWLLALGRSRLPQANEDRDQLWVRTASGSLDRLRGYLLDWTATGITFETSGKERQIRWNQLDALAVLVEVVPEQEFAVWLQLRNGGVLSARIVEADHRSLQLELPWGAAWSLPLEAVTRIRRRHGVEEWAGLDWDFEELPQAEALDWTPRKGKSIEGRPLRPGKGVFAQGIGVRVKTTLARRVPSAGILHLTVGVDQEVATFRNPQPVRFLVLFEGQVLADSGPMSVEDGARNLMVSVPGPGLLQLVAQPVDLLPFGGHADWCDLVWKPRPMGN